MYQSIPNAISWSRAMVAPPLLVLALYSTESPACHVLALGLMGYVILSDWLDGRLARRWKVISPRGKHLDPFADKVVELTVYATLAWLYGWWLLWVLFIWITVRHVIITALRMFATRVNVCIAARWSGKIRTALSFGLAFALLARVPYRTGQPHWMIHYSHQIPFWLLDVLVWILIAVTLISLVDYVRSTAR